MSNIKLIGTFNRKRQIKDMKMGEEGYTLPWAYNLETGVLNKRYPVSSNKKGNMEMKIVRINVAGYEYSLYPPEDF
jgi:hypothetical protein|tara:strand:- start:315 stop:542 length:228 start_codon:yes stop_codon:yes gene_type:complete